MHPRNLIDLIRAVGAISVFTLSLLGSATAGAGTIQKVSVSPSSLVAGNTATVVVEGTGSCSRVELSFGDGAKANLSGKLATLPAPTLSAPHPYPAPGTFTITARAASSDCSGGTKSVSLTVLPQGTKAPSTSLGAAAARAAAGAPSPVTESHAMLTGLAIRGVQTEFAEAGSPVVVRLEGTGSAVCHGLVLDFGDKTKPLTLDGRLPFDSPPHVYAQAQTYTVKARAPGRGCLGEVSKAFAIQKAGFSRIAGGGSLAVQAGLAPLPKITALFPLSRITPGGAVIVGGEGFGPQPNQFRLVGNFPGGAVALTVDTWSDTGVSGFVPQVTGVRDQPAGLQVINSGGRASALWPVSFTAARETVFVKGRGRADCSNEGGYNRCTFDALNLTIAGSHFPGGPSLSGASGTDTFILTLEPGCVFERADVWEDIGRQGGLQVKQTPAYLLLSQSWFYDAGLTSHAAYSYQVFAKGPAGLPC
jgi:hypothetical protein